MFPAPPLPRGQDLNDIENRERVSTVFGEMTSTSQQIAYSIQHNKPHMTVSELFKALEEHQAMQMTDDEEHCVASSSTVEEPMVIDELMPVAMEEDPEPKPAPRPIKKKATRTKAPTSVVNKPTADS